MSALDARIRVALCGVNDPCSVASSIPLNVLDMGLVRGWTIDDGHVGVRLILTSVACWHATAIADAIERRLLAIDGVDAVSVELDHETLWQPRLMSGRAREAVERKRSHTLRATGTRPQAWRERAGSHRDGD
jgi:metal-sulfur cluster biosynthetic enzyme